MLYLKVLMLISSVKVYLGQQQQIKREERKTNTEKMMERR